MEDEIPGRHFASDGWRLSFTHTAAVAAKFDLIPHTLPFLAPSKGSTTGYAGFLGKMLFFYAIHGS
jgi:hypothetical protein